MKRPRSLLKTDEAARRGKRQLDLIARSCGVGDDCSCGREVGLQRRDILGGALEVRTDGVSHPTRQARSVRPDGARREKGVIETAEAQGDDEHDR
jgi:hypothetical protein